MEWNPNSNWNYSAKSAKGSQRLDDAGAMRLLLAAWQANLQLLDELEHQARVVMKQLAKESKAAFDKRVFKACFWAKEHGLALKQEMPHMGMSTLPISAAASAALDVWMLGSQQYESDKVHMVLDGDYESVLPKFKPEIQQKPLKRKQKKGASKMSKRCRFS